MKFLKSLIFIYSLLNLAIAQNDQTKYAFKVFEAQMYYFAIQELQKAYIAENNKTYKDSIILKMGICYTRTQKLENAIEQFEKIIDRSNIRAIKAEYALTLIQSGQYQKAIEILTEITEPNAQEKRLLKSAKYLIEKKEKTPEYSVFNIKNINSPMSDFCPMLKGNRELIITSNRKSSLGNATDQWTGQSFSDIYTSQSEPKNELHNQFNIHWTTPIPINAINTHWHEGSISIYENTFYFTECSKLNKQNKCRIYSITKEDGQWQEKQLVLESDSIYNVGHPCISKDGKTLFFSSNIKGFGKKDIFKITYNSITKKWSTPKNMGKFINTTQDEMYPSIDDQGNLYFASNGKIGLGGLDIYMATKASNFNDIIHLETDINSIADDFAITFFKGSQAGFFSSNRNGGMGSDDIYGFLKKRLMYNVNGNIIDAKTGAPLENVSLEVEASNGKIFYTQTNVKGIYQLTPDVLDKDTSYKVNLNLDKYLNKVISFSTVGIELSEFESTKEGYLYSFTLNSELDPISRPIVMPRIEYEFNSAQLKKEGKKSLDDLVELLDENRDIVIQLRSHTDHIGSEEANLKLSQKRAESCINYLIEKGVEKERLYPIGMGEKEPFVIPENFKSSFKSNTKLTEEYIKELNKELDEEARQYNRRTDFKVLGTIKGITFSDSGEKIFQIDSIAIDTTKVIKSLTPKEVLFYTLKKGENLLSVSEKFDLSVVELKRLNGGLKAIRSYEGIKLKVSLTSDYTEFDKKHYRLTRVDRSWEKIAQKTNLSVEKVKALNPKISEKDLKNGMLIIIQE